VSFGEGLDPLGGGGALASKRVVRLGLQRLDFGEADFGRGEFGGEPGSLLLARAKPFAEGRLAAMGEKPDDERGRDSGGKGDKRGVHAQDLLRAMRPWQSRDVFQTREATRGRGPWAIILRLEWPHSFVILDTATSAGQTRLMLPKAPPAPMVRRVSAFDAV